MLPFFYHGEMAHPHQELATDATSMQVKFHIHDSFLCFFAFCFVLQGWLPYSYFSNSSVKVQERIVLCYNHFSFTLIIFLALSRMPYICSRCLINFCSKNTRYKNTLMNFLCFSNEGFPVGCLLVVLFTANRPELPHTQLI